MRNEVLKSDYFRDGMLANELSRITSVCQVEKLKSQQLIRITHTGKVYLTTQGKLAREMGMRNYLRSMQTEREILDQELLSIRSENRGLLLVFGGLLISLVFIIGFWAMGVEFR